MNKEVEKKLKYLPKTPGVYFHKNAKGEIIYVGKAAVLSNRVRQYFHTPRLKDAKTRALILEIADVDWTEVETELDALFLEAELIRRYLPPYNILLRDDKSLTYVRINYKDDHPTVTLTRRPLDDGAQYFGPYFSAFTVRRALKFLRKPFPYSTHIGEVPKRACLQYHLGLCPGLEASKTSLEDYRANLRMLMKYLKGQRVGLMKEIEKNMETLAKQSRYEEAAIVRNKLMALKGLSRQIVFSDRENLDISKDLGLSELTNLLGLGSIPRRVEGFDISHMQGTDNVASMVVFVSGLPDKAAYRKFKMRLPGNDDFAHINETITRRLSEKNRKDWKIPDLILIDGGKGQLSAAIDARDKYNLNIPMIGLAKREEEIVIHNSSSGVTVDEKYISKLGATINHTAGFSLVLLPKNSHAVKLIQRIRDESHRFAVSYHAVLRAKRQTASLLDAIPTIGPQTRKKLISNFGSLQGVMNARKVELEKLLGVNKAKILSQYLRPLKRDKLNK